MKSTTTEDINITCCNQDDAQDVLPFLNLNEKVLDIEATINRVVNDVVCNTQPEENCGFFFKRLSFLFIEAMINLISMSMGEGERHILTALLEKKNHLTKKVLIKRWYRFCRLAVIDIAGFVGINIITTVGSIKQTNNGFYSAIMAHKEPYILYLQHKLEDTFVHKLIQHRYASNGLTGDNKEFSCHEDKPKRKRYELPLGLIAGPSIDSRNRNRIFKFGNYNTYYSLRREVLQSNISAENSDETSLFSKVDPRLIMLYENYGSELFVNKNILDVGCNIGLTTITLAGILKAKSVMGIDIDAELISRALQMLRTLKYQFFFKFLNQSNNTTKSLRKLQPTNQCTSACYLKNMLPAVPTQENQLDPVLQTFLNHISTDMQDRDDIKMGFQPFPFNMEYRSMDFVKAAPEERARFHNKIDRRFDTIVALSVTKWIHLNYGDSGLQKCFQRMFRMLRPGGFLVLEPQSWESYRKKRRVEENMKVNLQQMVLRPEYFDDYLQSQVGFEYVNCLHVSKSCTKKLSDFFNRPLFIYKKPLCDTNN